MLQIKLILFESPVIGFSFPLPELPFNWHQGTNQDLDYNQECVPCDGKARGNPQVLDPIGIVQPYFNTVKEHNSYFHQLQLSHDL